MLRVPNEEEEEHKGNYRLTEAAFAAPLRTRGEKIMSCRCSMDGQTPNLFTALYRPLRALLQGVARKVMPGQGAERHPVMMRVTGCKAS